MFPQIVKTNRHVTTQTFADSEFKSSSFIRQELPAWARYQLEEEKIGLATSCLHAAQTSGKMTSDFRAPWVLQVSLWCCSSWVVASSFWDNYLTQNYYPLTGGPFLILSLYCSPWTVTGQQSRCVLSLKMTLLVPR